MGLVPYVRVQKIVDSWPTSGAHFRYQMRGKCFLLAIHFCDLSFDDVGDEHCNQALQNVGVELAIYFVCKLLYLGVGYLSAPPTKKEDSTICIACHSSNGVS